MTDFKLEGSIEEAIYAACFVMSSDRLVNENPGMPLEKLAGMAVLAAEGCVMLHRDGRKAATQIINRLESAVDEARREADDAS